MQNGAPAHISKMAMEWLKDRFREKLISLKSEFIWPPRSPDLNHLHFYLWGCMKSGEKILATISQMKEQVKEIIVSIPVEILQRVIAEFSRRIRSCIIARGRIFEK